MRTIVIAAALAVTLAICPAFAGHGGHAAAQGGNPVWQNPAVDQMPNHYPEYSAPVDPSFQPPVYQYVPPRATVICTPGKKHGQYFCN